MSLQKSEARQAREARGAHGAPAACASCTAAVAVAWRASEKQWPALQAPAFHLPNAVLTFYKFTVEIYKLGLQICILLTVSFQTFDKNVHKQYQKLS